MKRQEAFRSKSTFLKGALHVHTTRSDGKNTPEEVLSYFASHGYDFVTLTDHRFYNYNNYGNSPLTIVPGMEMDSLMPGPGYHCHHIVCIGPSEKDGNGYKQDDFFDHFRCEAPEETQTMLDDIHARNNMTILCHPQWSGTPAREFDMLKGNFAMEIWNSSNALQCRVDTNAAYWDDLLFQGQRIWGVAADDAHKLKYCACGWVMVNAENNLNSILSALKNGAFYSSTGPEIYDFYVEHGVAHIKCSPCAEIGFRHLRDPYVFRISENGELYTEYELKLFPELNYVRAEVMDAQGHRAWTNPIFLDDSDYE